jgi:tryptophan synthase alpha subunit
MSARPGRPSIRPLAPPAAPAAAAAASRLDATFERLRGRGERALVAYLMAGDPSLAETERLVVEAEHRGADVVELGVPFSDPLADGPVVQRADVRALAAGTSLPRVLEMVASLRARVRLPLVLMTYYNPILAFGLKGFARTAVDAGADGVIVPDLPHEEAEPLRAEAEPAGLDLIHLVAPTSTPARVKAIARLSRGFIYVVSLTGVTGARPRRPDPHAAPGDDQAGLRRLRRVHARAGRRRRPARRRRHRRLRHCPHHRGAQRHLRPGPERRRPHRLVESATEGDAMTMIRPCPGAGQAGALEGGRFGTGA